MKRLILLPMVLGFITVSMGVQPKQDKQTLPRGEASSEKEGMPRIVYPQTVREEVQRAFDEWKEAYADGDKEKFLLGFAQIPDLTIRISAGEWIGFNSYRDALAGVEIPKTEFPFREVRIVPIDEFSAMVTYARSSDAKDENGKPLAFRGTLVYAKTYSGWKVIAWHAHALVESPRRGSESRE
ncbi:MAG: nuclear transport factor 2 family protein [Acidobacteria bacterium]|nr:nuclear transport factor 2 family protein [Acidobacteriota bacterium]